MFAEWKRKREEKKAKEKAVAESAYWKNHTLLRSCLQSMRGCCTVAPMQMHEAVIATVNIALRENTWTSLDASAHLAEDFLSETVFLLWNDEKLPVLMAPWTLVTENMMAVRAVAHQSYLVSQTLDRIIWFDIHGKIKLYSIT